MAGEWPTLTLREAGVTLIDCDHRTPPPSDVGYPYVAIPQLQNGRINTAEARRITHEQFAEWTKKAKPTANDVVLSRRCNPGETAFVQSGLEFALGQNLVLLRADGQRVYPPFLRWLVRGPEWWEQIGKFINVGAVFDSLRCADVPKFELRIPPAAQQRAIAHILGALDAKIELNRRMNETLEAMARALFQSWFVDFDPVRAKAEGRDPGLPQPLADLFPDSFEDSEVGEIPDGWKRQSFAGTVQVLGGGTPKTTVPHYWSGSTPWFSVVDAPGNADVWVIATEKHITPSGLANSATQILPEGTTILSARGTVGRTALVGVPMAMNQSCYGLRGRVESHGFFTYFMARQLVAVLKQHSHGSVFDTITRGTLAGVSVVNPPTGLIAQFERVVGPALDLIRNNLRESVTLSSLSDTLLPDLISGALRLPHLALDLTGTP
jgi:type I restriction enzyme S subunit